MNSVPFSNTLDTTIAVAIEPGALGPHVGLAYQIDKEKHFLHLHWHLQLKSGPLPSQARCITPNLPFLCEERLAHLAALVSEKNKKCQIPYALSSRGALFSPKGTLNLGNTIGLSCATFISVLFDSIQYPLINIETWSQRTEERKAEDTDAQGKLLRHLKNDFPDHAQMVEKEIGSPRLRPEEIPQRDRDLRPLHHPRDHPRRVGPPRAYPSDTF